MGPSDQNYLDQMQANNYGYNDQQPTYEKPAVSQVMQEQPAEQQ